MTIKAETISITNGEWAPYLSEKVKGYGIASHIIEEAFKQVNIKVKWGFFPWSRSLKIAKKGKEWQAAACWFYTKKRTKDFDYSDPVVNQESVFFHLKSTAFDWKTISDLKKYKVGVTQDYSYGKIFDLALKQGLFEFEKAKNDTLNLLKVGKKRVQIFPLAKLVGLSILKTLKTTKPSSNLSELTYHQRPLHKTPLYLLFSKKRKDQKLLVKFNRGLQMIQKNGTYDKIINDAKKGVYTK